MQVGRRVTRDADMLNIFNRDICGSETVAHGFGRKAGTMLEAIEPFFLDGGN
jgi:hypothetical protein